MKVLLVNSVCGTGSTGRICTGIADVLEQCGHEYRIAYGRGKVPEKYHQYSFRIGTNIDVAVHGMGSRLFDHHGFYSKQVTKNLVNWIEEYDPDVIHLHNIHGYYLNIDILFQYLKTCRKKIMWTLHDCWAFTGHCSHFDYVGCEKWKSCCANCIQINEYPKCILRGDEHKNFERKKACFTGVPNLTIITPSNWLAGLVRESFLQEYPVKVIHNGIDLSIFKPTASDFKSKYHIDDNKKIVLGVSFGWGERKGLDVMIELAKGLGQEYQIVLVGTDKGVDKELPPNVISIHRTNNQQELAQIYSAADVFVNPTREDNYPTVNMEAIACGIPVVTFATGGSMEMLSERCGVGVNREDIDDLMQKVKWICKERPYTLIECREQAMRYDIYQRFYNYVEEYQK